MPAFSKRSLGNLENVHPDLRRVLEAAIVNGPDFVVICGHRNKADQDEAVRKGNSKAPFPKSKHNSVPARAVDIVPYPVDWNDLARFQMLGGYILGMADSLGVALEWGGSWRTLKDFPHFELKDE